MTSRYLLPSILILLCVARGEAQRWTMLPPPERPLSDLYGLWFHDSASGWTCGARGGAGRLYGTTNGGAAWNLRTLPGSPGALRDVRFHNALFGVVVGDGEYVGVTTDGGSTWANHSSRLWGGNANYNALLIIDTSTIVVVGEGSTASGPRMARSTDAGRSWSMLQLTGPANNLHDVDWIAQRSPCVVGTGTPPRRSLSTDNGRTWEANGTMTLIPGATGTSLSFYDIARDSLTATTFVAGGKVYASPQWAEVRYSPDGGESWLATAMAGADGRGRRPAGSIAPVGDRALFVPTRGGTIWRSLDGGGSWTTESLPMTVGSKDLRRSQVLRSNDLYVVGLGGVVLHRDLVPSLSIDRDTLVIGTSLSARLNISNSGDGYLDVDSVVLVPAQRADVRLSLTGVPRLLLPQHTHPVGVTATIDSTVGPGVYPAMMKVYTNTRNRRDSSGHVDVPIQIAVLSKALQVNNGQRDAGTIRVDPNISASITMSNVLENVGDQSVAITNLTLARGTDFFILSPVPPTSVAPSRSMTITVDFRPTSPCDHFDTVIVTHDATTPASPIRIPIRGRGVEPSIQIVPRDTINFGGVLVGASGRDTITIGNAEPNTCLDTTLVDTLFIIGPQRSEFTTAITVQRGTRLPPGRSLSVPMTVVPLAPGRRTARAVIKHELSFGIPDTVELIVNGLRPELTTVESKIVFGLTDVGGTNDTTAVDFLQNLGNTGVTITDAAVIGLNPGDFSFGGPATPFSLPNAPIPGHKQSIAVRFQPVATGTRQAVLRLSTSAGNKDVELVGTADSAILDARLSVILFLPETPVGQCRDTTVQRVIFNRGATPLRIRSARIGADPGSPGSDDSLYFSIVAPVMPPEITLQPGDSIAFALRFCPQRPGVHQARLIIGTNAVGGPVIARLTAVARGGTIVALDSVIFAPTRTLTSRDSTVAAVIRNGRSTPLRMDSITIGGADPTSFVLLSPAAPFTIDTASTASIQLRFAPRRRDRHLATLTFHHDQGTESVTLLGQSTYPLLDIRPATQASLRTRLGQTRRLDIVVRNIGDDSSRVESLSILGSSAYTNTSVLPLPLELYVGDSVAMSVDFSPTALCDDPAVILLRAEGVSGIYGPSDTSVAFAGVGISPLMSSRERQMSFGPRAVGGDYDSATTDFIGNVDFTGATTTCADSTTIDSIVIAGRDAASFQVLVPANPLLPIPSPAGGVHDLTIRFAPRSSGLKEAELRIYFDHRADSVLVVDLIGAGSSLPIRYGPASNMADIDFGRLRLGWERDSLFTLTNISTAPIVIDQLDLTATGEFTILSPTGTFVLPPNTPQNVLVRYAPVAFYGPRRSFVRVRSGPDADSSFFLTGSGSGSTFRVSPDTVDFGARRPPGMHDSLTLALNLPNGAVPIEVLDSVVVESATIVFGAATFSLTSLPASIPAGTTDSLGIRFAPSGPAGRRSGIARVYYDRHFVGGVSVIDSTDIVLFGTVDPGAFAVRMDPGVNVKGRPGDRIRVPLELTGDVDAAQIDSLDFSVRFRRSMLRPLGVIAGDPATTAEIVDVVDGGASTAVAYVRLVQRGSPLNSGIVGDLEFSVLLGDALTTPISIDSGGVPSRPEVSFAGDSMLFSVDEFCDAPGRLITFGAPLEVSIVPNPASKIALVRYNVPALSHTRVSLYNARGMEVARLVDGTRPPGSYVFLFDARDLPSGPYQCVLVAGRFARTISLQVID